MARLTKFVSVFAVVLGTCGFWPAASALASHPPDTLRRPLRVALYPYVPQRAEMYWRVEQAFEEAHPDVDLRYVDLGGYYYGGQLVEALGRGDADVFEVDAVFLQDLADQGLIQPLPASALPPEERDAYLPVALEAAFVESELYGVPHWVCGNFLFYRREDPERARFDAVRSLDGLERILGRPGTLDQGLLIDLRGSSTLGEKYLDAMVDAYQEPGPVVERLAGGSPDPMALTSLSRLFALCPGGLCDSEKHHEFGQYYAREFARHGARALVGYSERMHFVVDEYLHGVREGERSVGEISYVWNDDAGTYDVHGAYDVDAVAAPLADGGEQMLAWVDVLSVGRGVAGQRLTDALAFIEFFNDEALTVDLLVPEFGEAPRYLLPARRRIYEDPVLLQAAPLYARFYEIMLDAVTVSALGLNDNLRTLGRGIEEEGFPLSGRR